MLKAQFLWKNTQYLKIFCDKNKILRIKYSAARCFLPLCECDILLRKVVFISEEKYATLAR